LQEWQQRRQQHICMHACPTQAHCTCACEECCCHAQSVCAYIPLHVVRATRCPECCLGQPVSSIWSTTSYVLSAQPMELISMLCSIMLGSSSKDFYFYFCCCQPNGSCAHCKQSTIMQPVAACERVLLDESRIQPVGLFSWVYGYMALPLIFDSICCK